MTLEVRIRSAQDASRVSFEKAIKTVSACNAYRSLPPEKRATTEALRLYAIAGLRENNPILLLNHRDRAGNLVEPDHFLPYGRERLILSKVLADLDAASIAESEMSDLLYDSHYTGDQRPLLKEVRDWFSADQRPAGRYMKGLKKYYAFGDPIQIQLEPEKHVLFKSLIASYYGIYHSFMVFGHENKSDIRTGFDGFVARKLEYLLRGQLSLMREFGENLSYLFRRETIKDRIKGNFVLNESAKRIAFKRYLNYDLLSALTRANYCLS